MSNQPTNNRIWTRSSAAARAAQVSNGGESGAETDVEIYFPEVAVAHAQGGEDEMSGLPDGVASLSGSATQLGAQTTSAQPAGATAASVTGDGRPALLDGAASGQLNRAVVDQSNESRAEREITLRTHQTAHDEVAASAVHGLVNGSGDRQRPTDNNNMLGQELAAILDRVAALQHVAQRANPQEMMLSSH